MHASGRLMALAALALTGWAAFGAEASAETPAERRYRTTGGRIEVPGSRAGCVACVDRQGRVPRALLAGALAQVAALGVDVRLTTGKDGRSEDEERSAAGAGAAVIVVDDASLPVVLVAPDSGWAKVNVAKLDGGGAERLAQRVRKETLRAFALLCGGASSQYGPSLADAVGPEGLDGCQEMLPMDVLARCMNGLRGMGVKPSRTATYRRACEEGWAPAPTNDVQKAIWERAKADKERGPANPITIPPPGRK